MPHLPRQYAPTFGDAPGERPAAGPAEAPARPARQRLGLDRLSPHSFQPDLDALIETMFGTEATVDDRTGQLVPTRPAG